MLRSGGSTRIMKVRQRQVVCYVEEEKSHALDAETYRNRTQKRDHRRTCHGGSWICSEKYGMHSEKEVRLEKKKKRGERKSVGAFLKKMSSCQREKNYNRETSRMNVKQA